MFYSSKKITLGSTCFRQPFAETHCKYLHGYNLEAVFYFQSEKLDKNNWVVDFGGLKLLKQTLKNTFDHKTIISKKDPHLIEFTKLELLGIIDLVVMEEISIEMFALFCLEQANDFLISIGHKAICKKVEVFEHDKNSGVADIKD